MTDRTHAYSRLLALLGSALLVTALLPGLTLAGNVTTLGLEASPPAFLGGSISATAALSGATDPGGTITLTVYGPDDELCAGPALQTFSVPASEGAVDSEPFTPTQAGAYYWLASYDGDASNDPAATTCGADGSVTPVIDITPPVPGADIETATGDCCELVTTNDDLDGIVTSPEDPIETEVHWPSGATSGTATITESNAVTQSAPSGYTIFGQQVDITVPDGSPADPITLVFFIDESIYPLSQDDSLLAILQDGSLVAACDDVGAPVAAPDPCVFQNYRNDYGMFLAVYTSSAAAGWNFVTIDPSSGASITLTFEPAPAGPDGSIAVEVTLSGTILDASGDLYIDMQGPQDPGCTEGPIASTAHVVSGDGTYVSDPYLPTEVGTYKWTAFYSGDTHNNPTSTSCDEPGSTIEVTVVPPTPPGPTPNPNPASETASATDNPETSTDDQELDGANTDDPVETTVYWPDDITTGTTTISESNTVTQTPPAGYAILGQQVDISAPTTTAASPLIVRFELDGSIIPAGEDETSIVVLRNGVPVPPCVSSIADPDPCVFSRVDIGGGDVGISIRTSAASSWNFAAAEEAEPTAEPTAEPSEEPTAEPSEEPTAEPSPTPPPTANPDPAPEAATSTEAWTTSDSEGDGADANDPVETQVFWPAGTSSGTTTITETSPTEPLPTGYSVLGQQVDITAPAGTASDPLNLAFVLDRTILPPGEDETTVVILRNGAPVPDCDPLTSGIADPDPCVHTRSTGNVDDIVIGVYTSQASAWNFATAPRLDYDFTGFYGIDMPPAANTVAAGDRTNLVFSLGGDQGMDIFAAGSPVSYRADCETWNPLGVERPTNETRRGLTYRADRDRYVYPWATKEQWDGTCRVLAMTFNDGSQAAANVRFPYAFVGVSGLDAPPAVNKADAGDNVALVFSLDGFERADVFASGFPATRPASCTTWDPTGPAEATEAANGGLTYRDASDTYRYAWNTPRSWRNTCRILVLRLDDGSRHAFRYKFR